LEGGRAIARETVRASSPETIRRRSRFPAVALVCALVAFVTSCAPPPPGSLESIESAARTGAHRRERRLQALEMRAVLRVQGRATGRLPAVNVTTRLAAPDRVRLQARWVLGLLLDAAITSDTLTAWMPSQRLGLRIPGLADTLKIREPARFLGRALVAGWQAPAEAWRRAHADSNGVELDWREGGESWRLRVDAAGRPSALTVTRDNHEVQVNYSGWHGSGDAALPSRIEVADGAGWVRVRMDVESMRPFSRPKSAWFRMAIPDDVAPLELDDLRRVLSLRRAK
jgi:hypothetical protein